MNHDQREAVAEILRNFTNEGPRDLDVALDAIEQEFKHNDPVRSVTTLCLKRLDELLAGYIDSDPNRVADGHHLAQECKTDYIRRFIREAVAKGETMPLDKLSRWLGYVQGVLAARGIIYVPAERDRTRPLFEAAYAGEMISHEPVKLEQL